MAQIIPATKNILISAGDPSGDLHGANLIKELKILDPELNIACLGGERMRKVSDRFIYNLAGLGAAGFAAPVSKFFLWMRLIGLIRKYMEEKSPAALITIDFYGFNHQILGLAKHRNIPAYYYISPQVWASRAGRAQKLARLLKGMIVILPFEEQIYKNLGVNCSYVGHPLLDILPDPAEPPPQRGGTDYEWKIGLMPGSRRQEIERHMPVFWQSFLKVKEAFPKSRAYIFAAKETTDDELINLCAKGAPQEHPHDVEIVREDDYSMRARMDFVVTCSGTATLENGLLGLPMSVVYKMPELTYQIAKRIIKVPYISLVNIIAGKGLVAEYIQRDASAENISCGIMQLFQNPAKLNEMRGQLLTLRAKMGDKGATRRAAEIILAGAFPKSANGGGQK
ncbi:MAG: lipid-A-disaccharide synthase [Elusimicrobiaceae bacterium]